MLPWHSLRHSVLENVQRGSALAVTGGRQEGPRLESVQAQADLSSTTDPSAHLASSRKQNKYQQLCDLEKNV